MNLLYRVFYNDPVEGRFYKEFTNKKEAEQFALECAWASKSPRILEVK